MAALDMAAEDVRGGAPEEGGEPAATIDERLSRQLAVLANDAGEAAAEDVEVAVVSLTHSASFAPSEGSVDDDQSDAEDRAQSMNLEDGEHEIPGLAAAQAKAQMGSSQGMAQAAVSETRSARQAAPNLDSMPAREEREPNVSGGMKPQGDDDDDDEYGNGGDGSGAPVAEGMYDPAEYSNLQVSGEIKELFQYMGRYKPHAIELETKMRPFIPDYIPAVGDIDSFVKVPRPDGKADQLGLAVVDELRRHAVVLGQRRGDERAPVAAVGPHEQLERERAVGGLVGEADPRL